MQSIGRARACVCVCVFKKDGGRGHLCAKFLAHTQHAQTNLPASPPPRRQTGAKRGGSSGAACAPVVLGTGSEPRASLAVSGTEAGLRSIGEMVGHSR